MASLSRNLMTQKGELRCALEFNRFLMAVILRHISCKIPKNARRQPKRSDLSDADVSRSRSVDIDTREEIGENGSSSR